jgi:amino acid transporter
VAAAGSVFPVLLPYTLPLGLAMLAVLTILNLRGVREAGFAFMVPTYLFIACLGAVLAIGIGKAILHGGHPPAVVTPPHLAPVKEAVTLWLLMRAFANGSTAMTGVEAVSNAVPIFREPTVKLAKLTLSTIVAILAVMLVGIAYVCRAYEIGATEPGSRSYQSVLSQLIGAVVGRGWFYYLTMATIFAMLALSANTSFAGLPRVCRLMALDKYLPEAFARRGRRLVYNYGIATLTIFAAILLIVFRGITNGLIPLFAIGALLSFTLSQYGMVEHWLKRRHEAGAKHSLVINATGGITTALTLIVVLVSKFMEGAWITVLLIPIMMLVLRRMRTHQRHLDAALAVRTPLKCRWLDPPIMVVPVSGWTRVAEKALLFAMRLSPDVCAVQVLTQEVPTEDLSQDWSELVETPVREAGLSPPSLKVVHSRYRELLSPVVEYARELARTNPRRIIGVVVPELVERRWYHYFLSYATLLRGLLLLKGGPRIVVITVPWYAR